MAQPKGKKPTTRRKSPQWRVIEQIVRTLEQSLDPGTQVTHDETLYELITKTPRQCDVVIRTGPRHRRTMTIVEVQKRAKKVGIQDYQSWLMKREILGAQHLICVSAEGFVASVQRDALLRGDAVRLMTLCKPGERPDFYRAETLDFTFRNRFSREIEIAPFRWSGHYPETLATDNIFRSQAIDGPTSMDAIATKMLNAGAVQDHHIQRVADGTEIHMYRMDLRLSEWLTWWVNDGQEIPIESALIAERHTVREERIPITFLAYEQKIIGGVIAWAIAASAQIGEHTMPIRIVLLPQENGETQISFEGLAFGPDWGIESASLGFVISTVEDPEPQMLYYEFVA